MCALSVGEGEKDERNINSATRTALPDMNMHWCMRRWTDPCVKRDVQLCVHAITNHSLRPTGRAGGVS